MIFKWIHCKVHENRKEAFSTAQEQWKDTSTAPGFIGQFGGWDLNNKESACIVSLWKDDKSFKNFMDNIHDNITDANNQLETYYEIDIKFMDPQLDISGKYEKLYQAVIDAKYLRVADCLVRKDHVQHFEKVQSEVWIPAMSSTNGMLGGIFTKKEDNYLVASLWDGLNSHQKYSDEQVSKLREKADVSSDIETMIGRLIEIIPEWTVLPEK